MLQPLGLPLCLPSHFLSSIRVNTFLHPYLPPKKFLLHKASLAAHLLPFLHISIAFSLSSSYHQCPLPPHQLRILSPGLIFGMIIKKSRDVLATSGDSAGILDRGFIRHGKCDLGSSLRNCAGFLAIFLPGVLLDLWSYSIGNTSTCVYILEKSIGTRCPVEPESLRNRRVPQNEAVFELFKGKQANPWPPKVTQNNLSPKNG